MGSLSAKNASKNFSHLGTFKRTVLEMKQHASLNKKLVLLFACNILGTVPYLFFLPLLYWCFLLNMFWWNIKFSQIEFDSVFNRIAIFVLSRQRRLQAIFNWFEGKFFCLYSIGIHRFVPYRTYLLVTGTLIMWLIKKHRRLKIPFIVQLPVFVDWYW